MGSKIQESEIRSSLSFNSYSSSAKLTEIAARVIRELEHVSQQNSFNNPTQEQVMNIIKSQSQDNKFNTRTLLPDNNGLSSDRNDDEEQEEKEEFEFSFVSVEPDVTADEIFHNGKIRPLCYPLFNTALLEEGPPRPAATEERKRMPLGKLFMKEEFGWSCSSSSEEDELEGVPAESYCVWNPKEGNKTASSVCMGKKSNSTGSVSKRWKLKNMLILHRSNSLDRNNGKINDNGRGEKKSGDNGRPVVQCVEDIKRRSYLPYSQDIGGLISTVNGLSRSLRPF